MYQSPKGMGGLDEVTVSSAPHTVVHWTRWACQSFVSLPNQHLILGILSRLATLKLEALGALASLNTICRGKTAIASPRGACTSVSFGLAVWGRLFSLGKPMLLGTFSLWLPFLPKLSGIAGPPGFLGRSVPRPPRRPTGRNSVSAAGRRSESAAAPARHLNHYFCQWAPLP